MAVTFKRGDRRPAMTSTLESPAGTAIPLTGCTVRFLMRTIGGTLKVSAVATIVDVLGKVSYAWAANDLDTAGDYKAEWEITYPDGTKLTVPNNEYIPIKVMADLGP